MNTNSMLWVDKYVGGILIYLLQIVLKLNPFGQRKCVSDSTESPRKIVVIKCFGMGSILQAGPLLRKIKEVYPSVELTFVTFDQNVDLLKMVSFVDEVLAIRTLNIFLFIWDTLYCLGKVRRKAPDYFMNLEFYSRFTTLFGYFSGSRFHLGFHALSINSRKALLTHCLLLMNQRHVRDNFLLFCESINTQLDKDRLVKAPTPHAAPPPPALMFRLKDHHFQEARQVRDSLGIKGDYVVLSPTCGESLGHLKKWKNASWKELALILGDKIRMPLLALGILQDNSYIHEIFGDLVHNSAGDPCFGAYQTLIKEARLVISLDSGPAHLADFLEVPVIALFGPETPGFYGVSNPKSRNLHFDIACSPCFNILEGKSSDCKNNVCMQSLTPSQVVALAVSLIQERR